ncbi:MAG TPA: NAD-dependent epimerase/dehydratase family protein [Gaiellaceae bacterium]|nr:NAD-dependent epimerase/dehydratase family protein [Gaiellaceae bacterium]
MGKTVLITGGAGFIGSHLADELLAHGYAVRALDNLTPQVHGSAGRPDYLDPQVELHEGDIRDPAAVARALDGVDAVVHLAARVGLGQSMYELAEYTDVNSRGTAVLLEALLDRGVERLLVASSVSVYGEGLYRDADGRTIADAERTREQLERGEWELVDADGRTLEPVPTPESKPPSLSSVYAVTKFDQERLCLMFGAAYGIPTTALRFFNTYGPRQALSNPYTGVLAIFASRLLNGKPPLVYEDGKQRRDFVSASDVARACRLALESDRAAGEAVNVASGENVSVLEVTGKLAAALGVEIEPELPGKSRAGDVRHCFADISRARDLLDYEPQVTLEAGIAELVDWLRGQTPVDRAEAAAEELSSRGLTI